MQSSASNSNGEIPEWFLLSDSGMAQFEIDELLLRVFRRLDAVYPERADLSQCIKLKSLFNEFDQVLKWLEAQKLVSGPVSNCSLTLSGMKAYRKAVEDMPQQLRVKLESKKGLISDESRALALQILRQHYQDYIERVEDAEK